MIVSENQPPFDLAPNDLQSKNQLEPGFYDKILMPEQMYKSITPFHIKTGIHNCFACENKSYNKPLELGNFDASVMVIGETPSDVDFQTKEGKLLVDTLSWANYDLNQLYFTSLIKCEESATPDRCQSHLLAELLCVQPQVIIALGYDVGKHFDPTINKAGYISVLMDKYTMVTTYRTTYAMTEQTLFEDFCHTIAQARVKVNSH